MHRELSSALRLGAASQVVALATSLAGLASGMVAAWRAEWSSCSRPGSSRPSPWLTRVRTTVDTDQVTFTQLGKRIRVTLAEVHSCAAHRDRLVSHRSAERLCDLLRTASS